MLDYAIQIRMLPDKNKNYMALTGNYSVAGFELTLRRKVNCGIVANIEKQVSRVPKNCHRLNIVGMVLYLSF